MNNKHWTDDTQQRQPRKKDIGTDGIQSTALRSQLASAQTNSNYVKIRGECDCESNRMNMWLQRMVNKWNVDCEVNEAIMTANER